MNPKPALDMPGNTPWEKLEYAVRKVFGVPKERVLENEAKLKRKRQRKRVQKQQTT